MKLIELLILMRIEKDDPAVMKLLTELLTPNIENSDEILVRMTLQDQVVLKWVLLCIENGGEMVTDPQTIREIEDFKRLDLKYLDNKAFGFIPKSVILDLQRSCNAE